MQFHANGFRSGDPDVQPASAEGAARQAATCPPAQVDVLIVGCGPAGLTLGAQLAAFPDISLCIVDQAEGPLELGKADGVACRSMEMFNAFGFAERVLREAYWVNETTFWKAGDGQGAGIVRSGRVHDTEPGLSEFPHVILNQARVHGFYLDIMRNAPNRTEPWYGRKLVGLETDPVATHPVTAHFEVTGADGQTRVETVRARYAVGCDGARSAVRGALGLALKGDSANQAWGVMDVLAVTDFPDIRLKSLITSVNGGTIVLIPREGGYLVRIYVEMDKLGAGERVAARHFGVEEIVAAANKVLHPYTLEVKEVAWWSVYEIGQRMCDRFDDVPEGAEDSRLPH
ncbi:MAG TPA: FAD-dependent monooxygenase, partial [Novosphingobium sp.]|nr:FAD-dependent monooxygenase [Novosphingobium sp.]